MIDYLGRRDGEPFEGGEGRDQLLELGSGRLIPGFEEQLVGAAAGRASGRSSVTFPDDYPASELAGQAAEFDVTVKEVKAKQLPELDDEFAADSAGFDSLAELREDIATRLREGEEQAIEREFGEAVLEAAVGEATSRSRTRWSTRAPTSCWSRRCRTLERQGISKDTYLQIVGKDEEELAHEAEPEAEQRAAARGGAGRDRAGRGHPADRRRGRARRSARGRTGRAGRSTS